MSPSKSPKSPKRASAAVPEATTPTPRKRVKSLEPKASERPQTSQRKSPKTAIKSQSPARGAAPISNGSVAQAAAKAKRPTPKKAPVEDPVIPAAIAKAVAAPAKKKRASAAAKPQVQETPVAVDTSDVPMVTSPASVARVPIPEPELWEQDSPVMRRISLLRTRNAQLSEQVHRLKKPT